MYKKCSKCGAEIPKEAAFCLKCFSSVEITAPLPETKKPTAFFMRWSGFLKLLKSRKFRICAGAVLALLLIIGLCILVMKNGGNTPSPVVTETSIVHLTETVPATQSNGELVTAENGEQVFDVIDVTQTIIVTATSTTEKQGFLANVFNDKSTITGTQSGTTHKVEETTDKKGFWDNLFGGSDTTEKTTQTTIPQTTAPSTTATSTAPESTKPATTTTTAAETSSKDFEYTISGNYATITKYNGSAATVIIPAVIEGCAVTRIKQNTFQNNSSIVTVIFESNSKQPYLWVEQQTFNSCPNLRFISFSETDLGILNNFATDCLSVENITVTGYQFKCIDGTLYYNTGSTWKVRYHCPASPTTEIRLPNNCAGFESSTNLKEAKNVKNIYFGKNAVSFPSSNQLPASCENIFIDSGNSAAYDVGGVAFVKNGSQYNCIYPPRNKTQALTLPENTLLYCQQIKNPYLKTLYVPATASVQYLDDILAGKTFSSLENLYFGAGHSKADYVLTHSDIPNTQLY